MATKNRQWLRDQVRGYLHDTAIQDGTVDTFIDMACARLGVMLRSSENLVTAEWQPDDTLAALPEDLVELKAIRAPLPGGVAALRSLPSHDIDYYGTAGGPPCFYAIRGNRIAIKPYQVLAYELTYWAKVTLAEEPEATNDALDAFPFVFLNAALEAGYQWKEDTRQQDRLAQQWLAEVREINRAAARESAGALPAMRAV